MDIAQQFGSSRERQHLPLRQMHTQGPHVRTILHRLGDVRRERTHMPFPALARHRQGPVFDYIESERGNIDYLPPCLDLRVTQR